MNRRYRRGPCDTLVFRVEEERLSNLTDWGLLVRTSRVQLQRDVLIPNWLSLEISLKQIILLNAELNDEQHSEV